MPLLSRHSLDPDDPGYVQTEWDIALSADKLIVPILVEPIPERLRSSPWFKRMSDYQWYDLAADYDANLRKLLMALLADDANDSFRETFSCDGPDWEGWGLGDWSLSDEDTTGRRSQSLHAKASLAAFGKPAPPSEASIAVDLGAWDTLEYTRRLALRSANFASRASCQVSIDDGAQHVVDERTQDGLGEHIGTGWTVRRVDVGRFSGRRIRLKFVLTAADLWSITSSAVAWVDNIRILRAAPSRGRVSAVSGSSSMPRPPRSEIAVDDTRNGSRAYTAALRQDLDHDASSDMICRFLMWSVAINLVEP